MSYRAFVVNKTGAWPINRLTHVHGRRCDACAFLPWCTGFERSLVEAIKQGPALALAGGAPLPAPVTATDALDRARLAFDTWPQAAALTNAREALSLLAPEPLDAGAGRRAQGRAVAALAPWLRLYARYGAALLPLDPSDGEQAAAAFDLFPPPRRDGAQRDPRTVLEQLARREALLERRIATVHAALAALPPVTVPACCARVDQSAAALPHFWRHASLRGEATPELDTSLVPLLAPFVTCVAGCEAARAVVRARLDALAPEVRELTQRLLSLRVIALGPWARAVVRGEGTAARLDFGPGVVLLTDPSLSSDARHQLRQAFAYLLFSQLEGGGTLALREQALVFGDRSPLQPGEHARRVAWVPLWRDDRPT